MSEYYKGYTQHLISTGQDDISPANVLIMNMIPGLYLMKHIGQEGYVLPVCKFINNYRLDVLGEVPININGASMHPRYDYASVDGKNISLHNLELIPSTIKGGIVVLNNLMRTQRIKRYFSFDKGNLIDLISSESISVLNAIGKDVQGEKAAGLILLINKPCVFNADMVQYKFNFEGDEGSYTDFKCEVNF